MKKLLLQAAVCMTFISGFAQQNVEVKTFELEPFVGMTYGFKNPGSQNIGPSLGLEARWNLHNLPIDMGAQLYLGTASGKTHDLDSEGNEYKEDIDCRIFSIGAVADYNFNRGHFVSPFIGVGLTFNKYDIVNGSYYVGEDDGDGTSGVGFTSRIGVEFYRHLRVALSAHVGKSLYSHAALTIGYAFGGGKKK